MYFKIQKNQTDSKFHTAVNLTTLIKNKERIP